MMARRGFGKGVLGLLIGAGAILLPGCGSPLPDAFRYRMTVEVDTPQGLIEGFAVREVRFSKMANDGNYGRARGEAVVVDLPNGAVLFALLTGASGNVDHASQTMWHIFRTTASKSIEVWPNFEGKDMPITSGRVPMLVTFDDLDDPTSVAEVDPDDLAASFGEGYALKRITVQITDEPVTTGIEERLEWLDSRIGSLVRRPAGVPIGEMPKAQRLSKSAFRSGVKK